MLSFPRIEAIVDQVTTKEVNYDYYRMLDLQSNRERINTIRGGIKRKGRTTKATTNDDDGYDEDT